MKGVLFTVMTFLLLISLITLATTFANTNLEAKSDVNLITSADKLSYAFESVKSQMQEATGVKIVKDQENLTFNDTIPRQNDVDDFLKQYGDFVQEKFADATLAVQFIDSAGNPVDWNTLEEITVRPFNITYAYPNTGKDSLEIEALNNTELEHLERMELFIQVNTTLEPSNWAPEHQCATPGTPPECLPFRAKVTNGTTTWDSGEKNFELDRQSNVQHTAGNGWVRIRVGSPGGGERILQVDIQGITINTSTKLMFDTTDFFIVNDPARLRVKDGLTQVEAGL